MTTADISQSSQGVETLAALANLGGQFVRVAPRDKKAIDTNWTNLPFDYDMARRHLDSGGNVGLLCGDHSAGLGLLDVDANYSQFCEKFPNLANAPVIIRGGADRGKILVRINGNVPPSKKWNDNPERKLEWLSNGRQGVCAGIHPEGQPYELINPTLPEPILTPEQLIDICLTWTGSQNGKQTQREHAPVLSSKGDSEYWLQRALQIASPGNRNETGLWLACQCRDAGISESETKDLPYPEQVSGEGYARQEWEATIKSVYSKPPRAPAQSNRALNSGYIATEIVPIGTKTTINESQVILEPPPNFDGETETTLDPAEWRDPWGEPYTLINAFEPRPPIEYLIQGLFKKPSLNMIYGAPGGLKTLLVQSLCLSVASGLPWFLEAPWKAGGPTFITKQAPTMFIDFDNGPDEMHNRIEALARSVNLDPGNIPFYYYSFPEAGFDAGNKLHIGELVMRIRRLQVGMLWFDNLGVIKGAASENTDEMIPIMNMLRYVVVETGVVLGLIHHQTKSKDYKRRSGESIRGHSSIEGSLDLALLVERDEYADTLLIKPTKTRGAMVYPFGAEFTYTHKEGTNDLETARFYSVPCEDKYSDKSIDEAILSSLEAKKLNKTQLSYAAKEKLPDIGVNRLRNRIDRLAESGKITETLGERNAKICELP